MSHTPRSKPVAFASSPRLPTIRSPRQHFKVPTMISTKRHTPSNRELLLGYHNDLDAVEEMRVAQEANQKGVVQSARPLAVVEGSAPPDSSASARGVKDGVVRSIRFAMSGDGQTAPDPSLEGGDVSPRVKPTPQNPFPSQPRTTALEEIQQRIAAYEARYQRGNLTRRMTTVLKGDSLAPQQEQHGMGAGQPLASRAMGTISTASSESFQKAFDDLKFSFLDHVALEKKSEAELLEEARAASERASAKDIRNKQRRLDATLQADRLRRFLLPVYLQSVRHHIGASRDEQTRSSWMTDAMGAAVGGGGGLHNNNINTIRPTNFGNYNYAYSGGDGTRHNNTINDTTRAAEGPFEGSGHCPTMLPSDGQKHKRSVNELIQWLAGSAEERIAHAQSRTRPSPPGPGWQLFRTFELCCDLCNFVLCKVLPPEVFTGDAERYKMLVASAIASIEDEMVASGEAAVDGESASSPGEGPLGEASSQRSQGSPPLIGSAGGGGNFFLTRVPQPPSTALVPSTPAATVGAVEKKQLTRLRAERALTGIAKARLQELMPAHKYTSFEPEEETDTEGSHSAVVTKGKRHLSSIKQTLQAAADRHGLWLSLTSPRLAHPPLHACAHIDGRHLRDAQKYRRQVVALTGSQPSLVSDGTETSAEAKSKATADHVARNAVTDIEDFHKPDDTLLPIVELLQDMARAMGGEGGGEEAGDARRQSAASVTGDGRSVAEGRVPRRSKAVGRQTGVVEGALLHEIAECYCSFVKSISDPELRAIKGSCQPSSTSTRVHVDSVPIPKCAFAKRHMIVSAAPRLIIDATIAYLRTLIAAPSEEVDRAERRHRKLLTYSITGEFRADELVDAEVQDEMEKASRRSYSNARDASGSPSKESMLKVLQLAASAAATSQQEKERMQMLAREQDDQLRAEMLLRLRGELLFLFTGVDERQHLLEEHQRKERQRWEALDARRKVRQQNLFKGGPPSAAPFSAGHGVGSTASTSPSTRHSPSRSHHGGRERERSPAPSNASVGGASRTSRDNSPQHQGASTLGPRRRSSLSPSATHAYTHSISVMMDDLKREDEEAVACMMLLSAKCGGVSVSGVAELTRQAQVRQHRQRQDGRRNTRGASVVQGPKGGGDASKVPVEGGGVRIVIDSGATHDDMEDIHGPAHVFPLPPKAAVFDWQNSHTSAPPPISGGSAKVTRPDVNPRATFLKHTASSAQNIPSPPSNSAGGGTVVKAASGRAHLGAPVDYDPHRSTAGRSGRAGSVMGLNSSAMAPRPPHNPYTVTRRDEDREMQGLAMELLELERHRRRHNPTLGLRDPAHTTGRGGDREPGDEGDLLNTVTGTQGNVDVDVDGLPARVAPPGNGDEASLGRPDAEGSDGEDSLTESNAKPPRPQTFAYEHDLAPDDMEAVKAFMAASARDAQGGPGASRRTAKRMADMHAKFSSASTLEGGASPTGEPLTGKAPKKKRSGDVPDVGADGVGAVLGHYQYHSSDGRYYLPLETDVVKTNSKTGVQSKVVKLVSVTQSIVGVKEAEAVERFKQACRQTLPGHDIMKQWYEYKTSEGTQRKYKDERKDQITIEAEKHLTNAAQPSGSTNTLQRGTFDVYGTSPLTVLWTLSNDPRQGAGMRRGKPLSINWTF